jgi:hypothetical protein
MVPGGAGDCEKSFWAGLDVRNLADGEVAPPSDNCIAVAATWAGKTLGFLVSLLGWLGWSGLAVSLQV